MPGHEVGVGVREIYARDRCPFLPGGIDVAGGVPSGINHERLAPAYQQIRVVRKHAQLKLDDLETRKLVRLLHLVLRGLGSVSSRFRVLDLRASERRSRSQHSDADPPQHPYNPCE